MRCAASRLVASQRGLDGLAHHRMEEARRLVACQHVDADQAGGQRAASAHVEVRDRRRVPQLAAVPEHGERLSEGERLRIESADARRHLADDPLGAAGEKLGDPRARPAARSSSSSARTNSRR